MMGPTRQGPHTVTGMCTQGKKPYTDMQTLCGSMYRSAKLVRGRRSQDFSICEGNGGLLGARDGPVFCYQSWLCRVLVCTTCVLSLHIISLQQKVKKFIETEADWWLPGDGGRENVARWLIQGFLSGRRKFSGPRWRWWLHNILNV